MPGLVQRQVPDVVLACAGSGALAEQMRQRAAELGVADHLRLLGALDLADLPALVASSDVFVAPHMGYTLIEAGLTGVPIVSYDYDFHAEIVDGRRDGLPGAVARRDSAGRARVRAAGRPRRGASHGRPPAAQAAARAQPGGGRAAVPPGVRPRAGVRRRESASVLLTTAVTDRSAHGSVRRATSRAAEPGHRLWGGAGASGW